MSESDKHSKAIFELLKKNGYDVTSVSAEIDEKNSPEVGFIIRIRDNKLTKLLKNYAYRIEII